MTGTPVRSYTEIRELIRVRLAATGDPASEPEAELLFAYLIVVAAKAHRRPEERLRAAFPRVPLRLREWLWAEVEENWRDVVNLVRQTSKHHMIAAIRRGVPPSAANDVVNHILWREFLALSPEGWRERTKEG